MAKATASHQLAATGSFALQKGGAERRVGLRACFPGRARLTASLAGTDPTERKVCISCTAADVLDSLESSN